jgi:hypothetical protein
MFHPVCASPLWVSSISASGSGRMRGGIGGEDHALKSQVIIFNQRFLLEQ